MDKIQPTQPIMILFYGFPGAGKTYFARQFTEAVHAAHLEQDRIRHELFQNPKYTKQENTAMTRIMNFMANEFLMAGISVVMDFNAMRVSQRRQLREMARQKKATTLVVWFQTDPDTAYMRNLKRDRRKLDDRFSVGYEEDQFRALASYMQHPEPTEDYVVVSGKHSFNSQMSNVMKKLSDMRIIKSTAASKRMIRPELVNHIPPPQPEPSKHERRNIVLR